jgi:uncharacterized SAM-binding protein YcdF (DUF218 family)
LSKINVKIKKLFYLATFFFVGYFIINSIRIYKYSFIYSETKADVIIVLGAGTNKGILSPIFKERINHSIYLYEQRKSKRIIFTGGYGSNQHKSDSHLAKEYAVSKGIPENQILIEDVSKYTIENLAESKLIMDAMNLKTALLVSDPLHMKRAMKLAELTGVKCKSSPTKTTMYKSKFPKLKQLSYETFYFSLRELISIFK